MNNLIIKLGLKAGMLNYVDNETPRHYFLRGNADEECLSQFAELIIKEAIGVVNARYMGDNNREDMEVRRCVADLKEHFGV
jgi:hypothetical protein